MLVDITPPIRGTVIDGSTEDIQFSSEAATIRAAWNGFYDPESHIKDYSVGVYVNGEHRRTFDAGQENSLLDNSMSFKHMDNVYNQITAENGAELTIEGESNGFMVDLTPPVTMFVKDSNSHTGYQSNNAALDVSWNFEDAESKVVEYRYFIKELSGGQKRKVWPLTDAYVSLKPQSTTLVDTTIHLTLSDGLIYYVYVTALNGAGMSTSQESVGVSVDSSPPIIDKVRYI